MKRNLESPETLVSGGWELNRVPSFCTEGSHGRLGPLTAAGVEGWRGGDGVTSGELVREMAGYVEGVGPL